jgi:RimJ/RimL family protein N-acetyltransferase
LGSAENRLETDRLLLFRLEPQDAGAMFAYRSLPEIGKYQGWRPGSVDEILAFIRGLAGCEPFAPGRWFQFGIRLRIAGTLVGDCGVKVRADDPAQAEMGVTIAPEHQGRGYATEAQRAVLDLLFGPLGKHRVFASADPRNTASVALMKRLGMRQEAHHVESYRMDGAWADDVVFAILKREWRAVR